MLWRCWLGGRKGIRPVKTEWCGAGVVICLERGADLHMAQLMPLPLIVSCFSKIQIGVTFLVPAHPGSPGQRAVKQVLVCFYCALFAVLVCDTEWLLRPNRVRTLVHRSLQRCKFYCSGIFCCCKMSLLQTQKHRNFGTFLSHTVLWNMRYFEN